METPYNLPKFQSGPLGQPDPFIKMLFLTPFDLAERRALSPFDESDTIERQLIKDVAIRIRQVFRETVFEGFTVKHNLIVGGWSIGLETFYQEIFPLFSSLLKYAQPGNDKPLSDSEKRLLLIGTTINKGRLEFPQHNDIDFSLLLRVFYDFRLTTEPVIPMPEDYYKSAWQKSFWAACTHLANHVSDYEGAVEKAIELYDAFSKEWHRAILDRYFSLFDRPPLSLQIKKVNKVLAEWKFKLTMASRAGIKPYPNIEEPIEYQIEITQGILEMHEAKAHLLATTLELESESYESPSSTLKGITDKIKRGPYKTDKAEVVKYFVEAIREAIIRAINNRKELNEAKITSAAYTALLNKKNLAGEAKYKERTLRSYLPSTLKHDLFGEVYRQSLEIKSLLIK